jgi:CxxC-x17-CxxC domain-containing protein
MQFADRQLTCMDCSQPFIFTAGEQEFYDRKGFKEEPKRCKSCRDARKTRRTGDFMSSVDAGGGRGNGNGNGNANGNGNGSGNGNGNGGPKRSSDADDSIGNRARPASRGPHEVREVAELRGRGPREMFDAICAQCGAEARVPFEPVAGRPVYCRDCYGSKRGAGHTPAPAPVPRGRR